MTHQHYLHLDVFTRTPLSGNQLAVFHEPPVWPDATLQAIAREIAFSETTFVYPPVSRGALAQVRIFTPGAELPMAGHPTIGTAFALAHRDRIVPGTKHIVFDLGVGPTRVDLDWDAAVKRLHFAWMTQPKPSFGMVFDNRSHVARALGLKVTDLAAGLPVQIVSCGVPFAFIPLKSRHVVDHAVLDRATWQRACAASGVAEHKVFIFSIENAATVPIRLHSRMFAPLIGIAEDPGTGGASGPLGSYLVHHGVASGKVCEFLSHQGVSMQRPCEISIRITSEGGDISRVQIGGAAFLAGAASLRV
jgi:trans-2,3-dihydro-3-hydroxyanthranilate isomerase